MPKGKFVIIEGGDHSGKSTFVKFLKNNHFSPEFFYTNEPGGGDYGQKIRHLLLYENWAEESDNLTKFHLYWASKVENFRKFILPHINAGGIAISDRFEGSTFAYQIGEEPSLEELFWQTRRVCFGDIVPVYIHFDVSTDVALERAKDRTGEENYFDRRLKDYREKVRNSYLRFFDSKEIVSYRVDSDQPMDSMIECATGIFSRIISR